MLLIKCTALLTPAFLAGLPCLLGQSNPVTPVSAPPPEAKYWASGVQSFGRTHDSNGTVLCVFFARTDTRKVSFDWKWTPQAPSSKPLLMKGVEYITKQWPTAVAGLTGLDAFVAGVGTENLQPAIEKWRFDPPTRGVDTQGGEPQYKLTPGRRKSTAIIWSSSDATELVSMMSSLPTSQGAQKLILFFPKKKRLSILDTSQGSLVDIAVSVASSGGGLVVPGLKDDYSSLKVMDHTTAGFLYVLTYAAIDRPAMVVIDANRNGSIDGGDSAMEVDEETWEVLGWGNPDAFIKH